MRGERLEITAVDSARPSADLKEAEAPQGPEVPGSRRREELQGSRRPEPWRWEHFPGTEGSGNRGRLL